jgi:hypothetical protein
MCLQCAVDDVVQDLGAEVFDEGDLFSSRAGVSSTAFGGPVVSEV